MDLSVVVISATHILLALHKSLNLCFSLLVCPGGYEVSMQSQLTSIFLCYWVLHADERFSRSQGVSVRRLPSASCTGFEPTVGVEPLKALLSLEWFNAPCPIC